MKKITPILGIASILLIMAGALMKQLHLAGASVLLGLGVIIFLFGFTTSFLFDKLTSQSRRALRISTIVLSLSVGMILLAATFKILHLPGAGGLLYPSLILLMVYAVFFAGQTEGRKLQLRKDRQLAAILFTDIVGFTAMMGEDEDQALRVLDQNRDIQKRAIRKHRGKWLKEMGDGSLVIFYTATEAISAAIEIQNQIQEEKRFNVRMGIHISEILFTDDDVFGDGVNVASRISDKASANEICISEAVYQNIRNREDLRIERFGDIELKNVAYKLTIYKIDASLTAEGAKIRKLAD